MNWVSLSADALLRVLLYYNDPPPPAFSSMSQFFLVSVAIFLFLVEFRIPLHCFDTTMILITHPWLHKICSKNFFYGFPNWRDWSAYFLSLEWFASFPLRSFPLFSPSSHPSYSYWPLTIPQFQLPLNTSTIIAFSLSSNLKFSFFWRKSPTTNDGSASYGRWHALMWLCWIFFLLWWSWPFVSCYFLNLIAIVLGIKRLCFIILKFFKQPILG